MLQLEKAKIERLRETFPQKRIAVVGDVMLDGYITGEVKRVSPEAPVPVVMVEEEFYRFGGAANVALNIQQLGGTPVLLGVTGDDNEASIFQKLLIDNNISDEGIVFDNGRPTTTKTRVLAQHQHVVRIDKEVTKEISDEVSDKIFSRLKEQAASLDGIILQDYNKGVLTPALIRKIIAFANEYDILITVDPKFKNFMEYQEVTVFKPNRKEAEDILGVEIDTAEDIASAGESLLAKLNAKYVLLTLGSEGIAIFEKGRKERRMPTKARQVADVSGAGDTVISTLTMSLASGLDILEASYLANFAGGLVCEEVGIVPIKSDVLFTAVQRES